jgi:hypothetical protein
VTPTAPTCIRLWPMPLFSTRPGLRRPWSTHFDDFAVPPSRGTTARAELFHSGRQLPLELQGLAFGSSPA